MTSAGLPHDEPQYHTDESKRLADELSGQIVGAAIEVHRHLGAGLLESAYEMCLCRELALRDIRLNGKCHSPWNIQGVKLDCGYRLDLVVGRLVIVEIKAVESIEAVREAQLLTYLRLTKLWLGLLINFNVPVLKEGIMRRVCN
jgi:GxxExxY protein